MLITKEVKMNITICKHCHDEFHIMYGYGNNTYKQFKEFMKTKKLNNEQ